MGIKCGAREEKGRLLPIMRRLQTVECSYLPGLLPFASYRHLLGLDERRSLVLDVRPPIGVPQHSHSRDRSRQDGFHYPTGMFQVQR